MNKIREVITYKSYFDDFFREQTPKVRTKIIKVLDIIEQIERIPTTYLKYIEGTDYLKYACSWAIISSGYFVSSTATNWLFSLLSRKS